MASNESGFVRFARRVYKFFKKKDDEEVTKKPLLGYRGRQMLVLAAFVGFSIYVGFFLLKFTVIESDMWRQKANNQQMTELTIKANRGTIYDANGTVLAQSSTVWDIVIAPTPIHMEDEERRKAYDKKLANKKDDEKIEPYTPLADIICEGLADILEIEPDRMKKACEDYDNNYYFIVKYKAEKPVVMEIQQFMLDNNIPANCIVTEETSKRYYPGGTLAANVIGFTDFEGDGVYGLEAYYDDYLRGTDGKAFYTKDGLGQVIEYAGDNYFSAVDGNSLVLTLDEVIQHYVEKSLEKCVSQYKVINRATAIVMNCKTGGIIAMATSPSYDLNNRSELTNPLDIETLEKMKEDGATEEEISAQEAVFREQQWKNKAITELYYPGSVFKTVTCASALDMEVISRNSTFVCNQVYNVAGVPIHCWSYTGHGTLTLQEAITKSCNPSFVQIGQAMGIDKFCSYFEAFGFTERTGIDLPGEAQSLYVPRSRMGPVELASSSFGQTNKITPIQMITAECAIVNGGYLVTPHLVDKIIDSDGNVIETIGTTVKRQAISEDTSKQMREILETIVSQNGGSNAYIAGYRIGGKSGTAEKIDEHNQALATDPNAHMTYVSTFVAAVPMNDPEIVMLVAADTPTGTEYYGSAVAAPVVSEVFKEGLEHLGIYPTYTAEEQAEMDAIVPWVVGNLSMKAETLLTSAGFKTRVVGDASESATVKRQIPPSGSSIPKGSTVVLYLDNSDPETGVVPNVIGCSVDKANELITNAGFNIKISGGAAQNADAKAVEQSVAEGTTLNKGSVVEVTFRYNVQSD